MKSCFVPHCHVFIISWVLVDFQHRKLQNNQCFTGWNQPFSPICGKFTREEYLQGKILALGQLTCTGVVLRPGSLSGTIRRVLNVCVCVHKQTRVLNKIFGTILISMYIMISKKFKRLPCRALKISLYPNTYPLINFSWTSEVPLCTSMYLYIDI